MNFVELVVKISSTSRYILRSGTMLDHPLPQGPYPGMLTIPAPSHREGLHFEACRMVTIVPLLYQTLPILMPLLAGARISSLAAFCCCSTWEGGGLVQLQCSWNVLFMLSNLGANRITGRHLLQPSDFRLSRLNRCCTDQKTLPVKLVYVWRMYTNTQSDSKPQSPNPQSEVLSPNPQTPKVCASRTKIEDVSSWPWEGLRHPCFSCLDQRCACRTRPGLRGCILLELVEPSSAKQPRILKLNIV